MALAHVSFGYDYSPREPAEELRSTKFYCRLNPSSPLYTVERPTFTLTILKSGGIFQPPPPPPAPHHPPCSHAWSLKVLWSRLEERPSLSLCPVSTEEVEGEAVCTGPHDFPLKHTHIHTYSVTHAHRHTLCSTWHTHAQFSCRLSPGRAPQTWPLARFPAPPDCCIEAHTHTHAQTHNPFQSNPK